MGSTASLQLAPILEKLRSSSAEYSSRRLARALSFAESSYGSNLHWTGETVFDHCLGTLEELAQFQPDEDTVIACLLHHVLEQKAMTLSEVEEQFGTKVRELISGIHLLSHITLDGRRRSIEDLRLMLLSVSEDIRIVFVCLCDHVRCLQFIDHMGSESAKKLSQDILQLFAPVAARLGIYSLKHRLEGEVFPVLYASDSERIAEQLDRLHAKNPTFIDTAKQSLIQFLKQQGIAATVYARKKQPYSIFQKMNNKALTSIEDIHDLFAFRVVVDTEEDCYRVLGLLHRIGRPLGNRFKDYIAFPKPNGYQSLHTTLAHFADISSDSMIEVQIRTKQMHRQAELGVAAHWSYKEGGATARALQNVQLHTVLSGQESITNEDDGQTFVDHIFVLTPRGDVIELPEGATPLDFAFQVHTDLGLSFRSARVNGSIVSLDYTLENGDVIEIQKHATPQPSTRWMQMLKMASSRSKLRRYLYAQQRPKYIALGRDLVNAELKKRGEPLLTTDLSLLRTCDNQSLNFHQREDILMKIGQGAEKASSLFLRIPSLQRESTEETESSATPTTTLFEHKDVIIEDNLQMPLRYAKCCCPNDWPYENIAGNVNRLGQVMVHRQSCRMYKSTNPERRIRVSWK